MVSKNSKGFDDGYEDIDNPFASKPKVSREKMYERPDPSKHVDCGQDRPIKINKSGQYNLNFIDWDNEWETVMSADPNSNESPIDGISAEMFAEMYEEYVFDEEGAERNQKVI